MNSNQDNAVEKRIFHRNILRLR